MCFRLFRVVAWLAGPMDWISPPPGPRRLALLLGAQLAVIAAGYDPILGIMHNTKKGSPALVLDLIEPERPRIDAQVLEMVATRKFAAADFIVKRDGVCRLSPQLARAVATLVATPNK